MKIRSIFYGVFFFLGSILLGGCAHYPVNPFLKECSPRQGYRLKNMSQDRKSDHLLLFLTFSGGGTRAAALAYGVLEELAATEIILEGRKRSLLDEVDAISSVSGGSFTAAYYGLFGRRIFEEFPDRFLKRNVQRELLDETIPLYNWGRLLSANFGRSDLAAEYYDKNIFEGGTFGDIEARGGPLVFINTTDLTLGTYFTFSQEMFDIICSDLSRFPVARAVAASSAVPVLLTPITLYNYAGSCNYQAPAWIQKTLQEPALSRRRYQQAIHLKSYMDVKERPYIHLVDGGISDNLGLRGAVDQMNVKGNIWSSLQHLGLENTRKVVIILVNAETDPGSRPDQVERTLRSGQVLKSLTHIPIHRYNFESVELAKESFKYWTEEIRTQRCNSPKKEDGAKPAFSEPDSCADIQFYLVEIDFDALPDKSERSYFKTLPTSFHLQPQAVDRLREAAHKILAHSPEFQRLLNDLR
jgi:NTE family protein